MANRRKPPHISQKEWDDVDIPPLSDEQLAEMRPLRELDPQLAAWSAKRRRGQRGPQKAPTKKPITLRVDPDVLAKFKATGNGWQRRMNDALRKAARILR